MNGRCPQDGGFIGSCGCTHPNHRHSELVKGLLAAKTPHVISARDAEAALREGFYVQSASGGKVGFGERLLNHIEAHADDDAEGRKRRLPFAIDTVKKPGKTEQNHHGIPGRTLYAKQFQNFGMLVITDKETNDVRMAFTIIPKREQKKRG